MTASASISPAALETPARSSRSARMGTLLKYKADRGPVTWVLFMFGVHLALWFLASPLVAALCVVPIAIACMFIAPINHHHQHLNTFRSPALNRLYDVVLSLQTGISPYGWVLHHNLGHHRNYLNQPPHERPDESHWTRSDGTVMSRFEYTVHLLLHHPIDIMRVGREFPKYRRYFLLMKIPVWSLLGIGLWLNPVNTLLVFIVPAFITLTHTVWATYAHHAGFSPDNHITASCNRESKVYNKLTGNLGYHTAHHMRPGVHWSLLPEIHAQIRHRIPAEQLVPTFWG